jgi:hypothetical protein
VSRLQRNLKHKNANTDSPGDKEGLQASDAIKLLEHQHHNRGPGDPRDTQANDRKESQRVYIPSGEQQGTHDGHECSRGAKEPLGNEVAQCVLDERNDAHEYKCESQANQ